MASTSLPATGIDTEKQTYVAEEVEDKAQYAEGLGDLQIFQVASSDNVKLAKDGKIVLIPQPSDSADDPLNWSFAKKHMVLASFVFASLVRAWRISLW